MRWKQQAEQHRTATGGVFFLRMHECKPVFKLHIPKFAENAKQALLICQCKELKHVNMKQIQSLDKPLVDPMDA